MRTSFDRWFSPLLALFPLLEGCTWLGSIDGGVVTSPTGRAGRTGAVLEARGAMGDGQVLPGVALNGKATSEVISVGPAAELTVLFVDRTNVVEPFVTAALTPFALGSADGRFTASVVSPRVRLGVYLPFGQISNLGVTLRGPFALVLSGFAEYDLRAAGPKSEAFVGGTLGVGYFFQAL